MKHRSSYIAQLRKINLFLEKETSYRQAFMRGIFSGIGFLIGSAIVAVLLVGTLAPFVAKIPLINTLYQEGTSVINHDIR